MKTLLIGRTIKSYWATDFAKKRVTKIFAPFDSSPLWRILGGIFSPVLYFFVTFTGFLKSKNFDLVIAADPRIGIIFEIFKRIFGFEKPIIVHQLILSEAKGLKEKILKLAFQKIDGAIVNSEYEARAFEKRFPKTSFFFLPLHSDPACFELPKNSKFGNYIFSGGGAERDFKILIESATKIDFKFLIVTFSKKNLPKLKLPKNVEVKFNLPELEYFKLIVNSRFVVVPLKKVGRSAGQTTVVQAMSIGKAIIASDVPGLRDYIENDKTGVLVEPQNLEDLVKNIKRLLENQAEIKNLSNAAFDFAKKNFTYKVYDQRMAKILTTFTKNLKITSNSA